MSLPTPTLFEQINTYPWLMLKAFNHRVGSICCFEQSYSLLSFVFVDVAVYRQLQEYEEKIFGSIDSSNATLATFPPVAAPLFGFGFPKVNDGVPIPAFNNVGAPSIFARPTLDIPPQEFTFGAGQTQSNITGTPLNPNPPNPNASDISMDSS